MKFNKNARNALISIVLGDGHIGVGGNCSMVHSTKQLDYLQWKQKYLNCMGVPNGEIKFFDNSGFPGCKLYVNVSRWGKLLRRFLWKDGYKNIYNRKLLNRLDPIHIAIWYMDDGGLSQKKKNGIICANDLMLNTHTTIENNNILIDYFIEVWGVKFTQVKNKGHYRLRCGTHQARIFLDIVREYVSQIPSMSHKLNIKPLSPKNWEVHSSEWKRIASRILDDDIV